MSAESQELFEELPFERANLENGVEVLSMPVPHAQSVVLGFWLENGSRYQSPEEDGFAHLLEHMLFKGGEHLDATALSDAMEPLGGNINAYTDRELTVYHATVLGEDLPAAFGILQELVAHATLPVGELALEKRVVAQEAAMVAEDPEDWVQEALSRRMWGNHPLGWPILGRSSIIRRASRARLLDYYRHHYVGKRLKVVAAGQVDHGRLLALAQQGLSTLPAGGPLPSTEQPRFMPGRYRLKRQTLQAHLAWAAPGFAVDAPEYYVASMANLILGGSSGSRLFREIRERLGLAYSVYSQLEFYRDSGEWRIYAGANASDWQRCEQTVQAVLQALIQEGPTPAEMERTRRHLRAQLLMSLEDVEARMSRLARQLIYLGRTVTVAESLAQLDAVQPEEISALLQAQWADPCQVVCLPVRRNEN